MADTPDPSEFDYWNRGRVYPGLRGKSTDNEFDYWNRGEVLVALDSFTSGTPKSDSDTGSLSAESGAVLVANLVSDSDAASIADLLSSLSAAVAASETESIAEQTPSIAVSDSDAISETGTGNVTDAIPPPAPDFDTVVLSSTASIAATLSSADTASLSETGSAVIATALALADSDSFALSEAASNASGGIGNSFIGVVLAFDNAALDASPTWTRIDDPNGTS